MGKWTVKKNYGGAYICLGDIEIAHVPNTYSSELRESKIPMDGMERAKWLCDILNGTKIDEDNSK